ncbi:hypothetical protein NP493_522g00010 [Ridgeia piscesae]|uniref:Uncharacterized protein n=1 Tax=Ridgeia piscesae TaxID=27915 RepID=A0AAD9KWD6_RIDPI|nr:hypothetical protein NP493_522g00010 [Ridgeia piscesae]
MLGQKKDMRKKRKVESPRFTEGEDSEAEQLYYRLKNKKCAADKENDPTEPTKHRKCTPKRKHFAASFKQGQGVRRQAFRGQAKRAGKGGVAILAQLLQYFPCHDGDHRSRRGSVLRQVIRATSSSGGDTAASNRGRRQIRLSRTSQGCAACGWRPHSRRDSFCGTSSRHAAKLDQGRNGIEYSQRPHYVHSIVGTTNAN